jgi:F-type H+-transporting ATPase subunit gamma
MAKTHDLKRRIRSIKNTMQVTKAMKMVSAARLRRAQDRILATRPFAMTMGKVLTSLAARANPERHPLLVQRPVKRIELVLVTSDRGLCGSFNANAIKTATAFLLDKGHSSVNVMTVGRRGRDFVRRRKLKITAEWIDVFRTSTSTPRLPSATTSSTVTSARRSTRSTSFTTNSRASSLSGRWSIKSSRFRGRS